MLQKQRKFWENEKSDSRGSSCCEPQPRRSNYRFSVGVYEAAKNAITFELWVSCIILSAPRPAMTSVQILKGEEEKAA